MEQIWKPERNQVKYFTKDWYELSQQTGYHLGLKEESRAETFSESYFQELYSTELSRWLHVQEEVAFLMQESYGTGEPFEPSEATRQFQVAFKQKLELYKRVLPGTVLDQIADLRVFALDTAAPDVIQAVTRLCEHNERSVRAATENYTKYFQEAFVTMENEIVQHFGFHDCTVKKSILNDNTLTLWLDNAAGFTDIDQIIFENAEVLQHEAGLDGAWWLYEEIYKANDKYEFHVLLQSRGRDLIEWTVSADKVIFLRTGSNRQQPDEINRLLAEFVEKPGNELGVAFGVVMKVNINPEILPSWTIRIDNSKTVLTPAELKRYVSEHIEVEDALASFLRDHFPEFAAYFESRRG